MNRRDFLKKSAIAGGTIAAVSAVRPPIMAEAATNIGVKTHTNKTIDDLFEMKDVKPFKKADNVFSRYFREKDPTVDGSYFEHPRTPQNDKPGYTQLDYAAAISAELTALVAEDAGLYGYFPADPYESDQSWQFESPEEANKIVKRIARSYQASAVGIAPYDERFMYEEGIAHFKELGFKPKSIVVIAVEMDYDSMRLEPMRLAGISGNRGYANMAEVASKVGHFLKLIGYNSFPTGNEMGLSVPIAIEAGLGEPGRMGILIHPTLGPRLRISKVYTDLEIARDYPITFGVKEFCNNCMKCADECPSGAVQHTPMQFHEGFSRSVRTDIKKWSCKPEDCFAFWGVNMAGCQRCLAACPYNKHDTWNHQMTRVMAGLPGFNKMARSLDDVFGYGKSPFQDEKLYDKFWDQYEDKI